MEEEMEELYVEGLATHGDPESCVDVPRGRGEALAGARAGRAMRESSGGPARPEIHGMYGTSMRENREIPCPARRADRLAGRSGKAQAVRLRCTSAGSRTVP